MQGVARRISVLAVIGALVCASGAEARTYTVNKAADPGPANCQFKKKKLKKNKCSLRSAIDAANLNPGTDTIKFRIGKGAKTITPGSSLPAITDQVTITGWTQKGFKSKPLIEINGADFAPETGLLFSDGAEQSIVRGLILNGNATNGIRVFETTGVVIQGCWVGINPDGSDQGVGGAGISLENSPSAVIGGPGKAGNVISGNAGEGIDASGNALNTPVEIVGNRIGTSPDGNTAVGNGDAGIDLANAPGTIEIGQPGAGNVVSGNAEDGIRLGDFDEFNGPVTIIGNKIGTNAAGTADLGNGNDGIYHVRPRANHIGGTTAATRNVISGNGGAGIHFELPNSGAFGAIDNWIRGNYIGTNAAGTTGLGNDHSGIWLDDTSDAVQVGGAAAGEGNVVAGSEGGVGVRIEGSDGAAVLANKIGVNKDSQVVGTGLDNAEGLLLQGGGPHFVGAAQDGTPGTNVVSNNGFYGIHVNGGTQRYISGNRVGTDASGGTDLGNGSGNTDDAGILIEGDADGYVGENAQGGKDPNLIYFNNGNGVRVKGDSYFEITRNPIAFNDRIAIDLVGGIENLTTGVTTNDDDDPDGGANRLVNKPTITAVTPSGNQTNFTVAVDAIPNRTYLVEVFANQPGTCDPGSTGSGNGGQFLNFITAGTVVTNASGVGSATFTLNGGIGANLGFAATASHDELIGTGIDATSEFGPCITGP